MIRPLCMLVLSFLGIARLQAQDDAPLVVYFGDSITEGWIDAQRVPQYAWPHICDSLLHAASVSFRSLTSGRAGETSRDAVARFDADVLAARPAAVVIAYGSNDYYIHGYATEPRVSVEEFSLNLRAMIRKCAGLGIGVIVCDLPPNLETRFYRYSPPQLYAPFGGASAINRTYNAAIHTVCRVESVAELDIAFGDSLEQATLLGFDGVHPTHAGHAVIARALAQRLPAVLAAAGSVPSSTDGVEVFPNPVVRGRSPFMYAGLTMRENETASMTLFTLAGREVRRIGYRAFSAGKHYITWDGTNDDGQVSECGFYIALIETSSVVTRKMIAVF